nr:hypothetical protein [Actinomycetota bacterium]
PPARARRGLVVAAVVLLAGLVAALVVANDDDPAVAVDRDPRPTTSTDAETTTTEAGPEPTNGPTTTTTAPTEADFDALIAEIQAFVSAERGLPFLRPVTVELAADEDFEARLLADFEEDEAELRVQGQVLEAVGLLEPGTDIVDAFRALLGAGVVGFYDPETDELVVRGTGASPYVRTVIAHELVHALDDQHFELHRPALEDVDDETGAGFTGLVEGDARQVEDAYRATFTDEEEAAASAEELELGSDPRIFDVPIALLESLQAPYTLGPGLITALREAGDQALLDAAFAAPPVSTEQLLAPETFVAGQLPVPVTAPAADGEVIDAGVLGALGLAQILGLGPVLNPGPIDPAILGWGGDRYVAWVDGNGLPCLRAAIVGDTPTDTDELRDALSDWADDPPFFGFPVEATVTGGDGGAPITLTSCSLG